MRGPQGLATLLTLVFSFGCGPEAVPGQRGASMSAAPAQVSAAHPTSVLTFTAWDAAGAPGEGTVRFSTTGGALVEGTELTLNGGRVAVTFRCLAPGDPNCAGPVEIAGEWSGVSRSVGVTVVP